VFALFTSGWSLLWYLNIDTKASIKAPPNLACHSILAQKYFLTFSLLDVSW
jgi:hypothetical protein